MDSRTRTAIQLLGKGNMSQTAIADVLDVTPSAISRLAEHYSAEIAKLKADSMATAQGIDARLDQIETTLLDKIEERIPHENDLRVLAGIYKIANSAHRRGRGEVPTTGEEQGTARLVLNQQFVQQNIHFVKDTANRISQVGDTKLQTADITAVQQMLADMESTVETTTTDIVEPTTRTRNLIDTRNNSAKISSELREAFNAVNSSL